MKNLNKGYCNTIMINVINQFYAEHLQKECVMEIALHYASEDLENKQLDLYYNIVGTDYKKYYAHAKVNLDTFSYDIKITEKQA